MNETGQATQSSIREIVKNAASSRSGGRISQALRRREESRAVCFRIRKEKIASVVGTRRCFNSERAPKSKHGGIISMQEPASTLSQVRKILIFLAVVIGVLLFAYLLRKVTVPPDCESEPTAPACQEV